ncbi:hypothetical protein IC582_004156 [Cucumis melo]
MTSPSEINLKNEYFCSLKFIKEDDKVEGILNLLKNVGLYLIGITWEVSSR